MKTFFEGKKKSSVLFLYLLFIPVFWQIFHSGLDNFYWAEECLWLSRAAKFHLHFLELFSFYGRDFNPLFLLSLVFQSSLLSPSPWMTHFIDLLIHLTNGFLLAFLFFRFFQRPLLSVLLAVFFIISRHTDEAVFWMGARPIALSLTWFLLAWHAWEGKGKQKKILGAVFFIISILTKETGVLLAPILFFRYLIFLEKGGRKEKISKAFRSTAPLWGILFVYGLFRLTALFFFPSEIYQNWALFFALKKFAFLNTQFLEISKISWNSYGDFLFLFIWFAFVFQWGGKKGKFGLIWMTCALLPFLLIPKHSPRYSLYAYPGFLFTLGSLWIQIQQSRPQWARFIALGFIIFMFLYQGVFVVLDEKDYDMRSRYIQKIAEDYKEISSSLPDTSIIIISNSGINLQPAINARCRVSKLNAHISGGLWGLIRAEDLIGMVELSRGRVFLPSPLPLSRIPIVVYHTSQGFQREKNTPDILLTLKKIPPENIFKGKFVSFH